MDNVLTDPDIVKQANELAALKGAAETKPPHIPEKFWDAETGQLRIEDLVNSYLELEQKLSGMIARPDTDEARLNILHMMGLPETADEYEIDVSHGLFDSDPQINKKMHECGFTPEQAQTAYDLAAEKFVPLIIEMAEEYRADREVERLVSAFGGPEKWQEVSRQLLRFGQKNLPAEVFESMSGSYEGIMMMFKMMKGEDQSVLGHERAEDGNDKAGHLNEMMRDPRYWRDRDPEFVAKVTERFKQQYS